MRFLKDIERYRELTQKEIFGPGIRRQSKENLSLKEQLKNFYEICGKNSLVIIGSVIYKSENPAKTAE